MCVRVNVCFGTVLQINMYDLTKQSIVHTLCEKVRQSLQYVISKMDGAKCGKPGMEHIWVDPEEGQYIQCAVCANKANGFHYGADTCGACKGVQAVFILNYYRPQRSWGKVIFSVACVKNSVHRGRSAALHAGMHTPPPPPPDQRQNPAME